MGRVVQLALIATAVLCSACSPSYVGTSTSKTSTSSANATSSSSGTSTSTSTSTISSTGTTTTSEALIASAVSGSGYSSTTVTVSAGTVLKMTFTPKEVGTSYSQLGVYITVNGMIQNSGMLANGLTATAQASQILDFSSALSGCTGSTTCRQTVTIVVDHPNDDYYCYNFGEYCYWTQVPAGQAWAGTLSIQTDDTVALID